MKAFVWENVSGITNNWHDGGSLLVIATDLGQARDLVRKECPGVVESRLEEASDTYDLVGEPPARVYVFPDAGCC